MENINKPIEYLVCIYCNEKNENKSIKECI